ncbi:LuxR family transcriptional regulator [Streptomyces yokosukanensis]|uniref:LuxR family transcriptional regulator n=1 Tax=Streptomyces yokosukanensis TaxID=67386 RepID=A0A101NVQ9_9ACTN|nr:LuxR C-terminal-related transcriptional regulator [Streptomyces yokosukanensis]KUN00170.1 LuxR family transcriptional regulator [Streptomyces yokosukanensis]
MSVVTTSITASSTAAARTGAGPASRSVRTGAAAGRRRTYTAHTSPDVTITAAEAEFAGQFGSSPGEICGRALCDLLQASPPVRLRHRFTDLSEGRTNWFTERVTGRDGNGRDFSAVMTATAVTGPAGPAGLVILLRPLGEAPVPRPCEPTLSELDARVLEGVAGGASTVQLAARVYLSRQGVEYRVGQLLRRFEAPNRPALVARAHAMGLFAPGQWPPQVLPDFIA